MRILRSLHFAFFALPFAGAVIYGCGSSTVTAPAPAPVSPTPDTGTNDSVPDAAPPVEADAGDPNASMYPASHPPIPVIHNAGGRVLKAPNLVTVTFAGMDTTIRDYVRDFDSKILGTDWWTKAMDGYGVGPGTGGGNVELPDTFSSVTTSDADLQTWIAGQITAGSLPSPDENTVYMIYMPAAATIDLEGTTSCTGFGGYHNSGSVTTEAGTQRFIYAVMVECYSGFQGVTPQNIEDEQTGTASHEIAEAATDPDINVPGIKAGYYMTGNDAWAPNQRGGEVGDLCEGQNTTQGAWSVTKVWNMKSAKASHAPCVPEDKPVFFSAAPFTEVPGKTLGGAPTADGYIMVNKGETRKVEVDVFSTGPTDPITVVAGRSSNGGGMTFDPTHVTAVAKGVTVTLSSSTAKNGDKLTMTIAVDPTAATTTARFTVRAVLSATDYHSWPVILFVP